jgi:hypothetical protein
MWSFFLLSRSKGFGQQASARGSVDRWVKVKNWQHPAFSRVMDQLG